MCFPLGITHYIIIGLKWEYDWEKQQVREIIMTTVLIYWKY